MSGGSPEVCPDAHLWGNGVTAVLIGLPETLPGTHCDCVLLQGSWEDSPFPRAAPTLAPSFLEGSPESEPWPPG